VIRPWPEIIEHYESYARDHRSIQGIAGLARFIGDSPLARGLFAWTSMNDLCIVQTEVGYPYDEPMLVVSPTAGNQIEFRYVDTPDKTKQWHRIVEPDEAIARLLSFLDQLRWVPADVIKSLGQGTG
jgi:hypothetical protein